MNIVHLAAEYAPLAQVGGLGEVVAELTEGLARAGHQVEMFLPDYSVLDRRSLEMERPGKTSRLRIGARWFEYSITQATRAESSVSFRLVSCPALFDLPGVYSGDSDEPWRYALLAFAALEELEQRQLSVQIVHCHDWHAALAVACMAGPTRRRGGLDAARSVLTLHNLAYQGVFGNDVAEEMGLADLVRGGRLNFLESGIQMADLLTTVSPTYASEIQTPAHGEGLEMLLRERAANLVGVLNGVGNEWSPALDVRLPSTYSVEDLGGKALNRRALLEHAGLGADDGTPILAKVSRLVEQKGCELYREGFGDLIERLGAVCVVLGTGEATYEALFRRLQREHPSRIVYFDEFNQDLAHLIEAGSDIFLMPSRFEPCGLNQMYSMLYGTVPIVHRTGGLADTVSPADPESGEGTGFVFFDYTRKDFFAAVETAVALFAQPEHWRALIRNGMRQDFSWDRVVGTYEELYEKSIGGEV